MLLINDKFPTIRKRFSLWIFAYFISASFAWGQSASDSAIKNKENKPEVIRASSIASVFKDCELCPELAPIPMKGLDVKLYGNKKRKKEIENRDIRWNISFNYKIDVGLYEVTGAQYAACVKGGGCNVTQNMHDSPTTAIDQVPMEDAIAYTNWLSKITGKHYRLPSEPEWIYFNLAGATTDYFWGENYVEGFANCPRCSDPKIGYFDAHRDLTIGRYRPNDFGLYDTVGNVAEWVLDCSDWKRLPLKVKEARLDSGLPWYPADKCGCRTRINKGGRYVSKPKELLYNKSAITKDRSYATCESSIKTFSGTGIGFRVVRQSEVIGPEL